MTAGFLSVIALLVTPDAVDQTKLPDATMLRQLALTNMRNSAIALERYSCTVDSQTQKLDGNGRVQQTDSHVADRFFVNGVQVNHVLSKNGKPLSSGDARKEQERVNKDVKKFSNQEEAQKVQDKREKQFEMFLRAQRLMNGRRELRGGRNTLIYDLVGDAKYKAKTIEERFAQAVGGRVWIDEGSGAPIELKIETTRDVKIGGGLLANLHKGFELHLVRIRQPDGLWMNKTVEGNADVRAGLFFHPRLRFSEKTSACRLFSVDSKDLVHSSTDSPN